MGIYKLGLDGRLIPGGISDFYPPQAGQGGNVLETDGTNVSWKGHTINKGYAFTVSAIEFSNGYTVMPSAPVDITSLRVYAVGSILQINEAFAPDLPNDLPDFAYRLVDGEPRIYFLNVTGITSGLSEVDNLFKEGAMYIVYYETKN